MQATARSIVAAGLDAIAHVAFLLDDLDPSEIDLDEVQAILDKTGRRERDGVCVEERVDDQ